MLGKGFEQTATMATWDLQHNQHFEIVKYAAKLETHVLNLVLNPVNVDPHNFKNIPFCIQVFYMKVLEDKIFPRIQINAD